LFLVETDRVEVVRNGDRFRRSDEGRHPDFRSAEIRRDGFRRLVDDRFSARLPTSSLNFFFAAPMRLSLRSISSPGNGSAVGREIDQIILSLRV
jgi:hypothetical protein